MGRFVRVGNADGLALVVGAHEADGLDVGVTLGAALGGDEIVGVHDGAPVGGALGTREEVGLAEGAALGEADGVPVGLGVGAKEGQVLGAKEGVTEGNALIGVLVGGPEFPFVSTSPAIRVGTGVVVVVTEEATGVWVGTGILFSEIASSSSSLATGAWVGLLGGSTCPPVGEGAAWLSS